MFQLILVPWDGSRLAQSAIDIAVQLAVGYEAEIVAASVVAPAGHHREDERSRLTAQFDEARVVADAVGVPITHELIEGTHPAAVLLAYAHEHGFDLVVIGHRRDRRPGILVPHGITEHLVSASEVPLLVVAAPTGNGREGML